MAVDFIQVVAHKIKQLIHQLGFLHFRYVGYDFLACTFHPSGFGVSAAAAWKHKQACVGPVQGIKVSLELSF